MKRAVVAATLLLGAVGYVLVVWAMWRGLPDTTARIGFLGAVCIITAFLMSGAWISLDLSLGDLFHRDTSTTEASDE